MGHHLEKLQEETEWETLCKSHQAALYVTITQKYG